MLHFTSKIIFCSVIPCNSNTTSCLMLIPLPKVNNAFSEYYKYTYVYNRFHIY